MNTTLATVQKNDTLIIIPSLLLWKIFSPFIILLGTIGNVIIIAASRKNFKRSPISFLLTVLGIADLIVLFSSLLRWWVYYAMDKKFDYGSTSPFLCAVHKCFAHFGSHMSAWMLVTIAVQRTLSVRFPFRARQFCTMKSTASLVLTVTLLCFALDSHFLYHKWTTSDTYIHFGNKHIYYGCTQSSTDYSYFLVVVWPQLDFIMSAALPFFLLITTNSFLIYYLIKQQKSIQNLTNVIYPANDRMNQQRSITVMLVTNSLMFLILSTPVHIWYIGRPFWYDGSETFECVEAIVYLLWYSNYGMNLYLFCSSSPPFRKKTFDFLRQCLSRSNIHQVPVIYLAKTTTCSTTQL